MLPLVFCPTQSLWHQSDKPSLFIIPHCVKVSCKALTAVNFSPHHVKVLYKALTAVNFSPHYVKVLYKALTAVNFNPHHVKVF